MSSLQSLLRTASKDIEVRVDKQPESVQAMTENPAITTGKTTGSASDATFATRLRGGAVRYSRGVSIPIIYAYSRIVAFAPALTLERGEETIVFLIRSPSQ